MKSNLLKRATSLFLSILLSATTVWGTPINKTEIEAEKIQLAAKVIDYQFFLNQLRKDLDKKEQIIKNIDTYDPSDLATLTAISSIGFTILATLLSVSAYKFYHRNEFVYGAIPAAFFALFPLALAPATLRIAMEEFAMHDLTVKDLKPGHYKWRVINEIRSAQSILDDLIARNQKNVEKLMARDPEIKLKLAKAIENNAISFERFSESREKLIQVRKDLELNTSLQIVGGSASVMTLVGLYKSLPLPSLSSTQGGIILAGGTLIAAANGYFAYKRSDLLNTIDQLESELPKLEQKYKEDLRAELLK